MRDYMTINSDCIFAKPQLEFALPTAGCKPIVRWAGSKKKLIKQLLAFVPKSFERYIEPFAGSACLFFALHPPKAVLNDINPELIQFYVSIKKHPILTCREVITYPQTKDFYLYVRSLPTNELNPIEQAARFFFLNRMCFNGLYRTNKKGQFNVPMGSKTGTFPSHREFIQVARALENVCLLNQDFEEALSDIRQGDFIYLDPPYFSNYERRRNEYGNNCFTTEDLPRLIKILEKIDNIGATFLLSYTNNAMLLNHLRSYKIHPIVVRRSISGFASHRKNVEEVIITNRVN